MVFLAVAIHRSFRSIIECAWLSDEFYYRSFERDRGVSASGEPPGALLAKLLIPADEFDVCPFTGRNRPKSTIAVGAASDRPKVQ